ncbi:MAG: hypothetical protein M0Z31_15560 [Clostridia bacterium]|nr:hypothetical protein [Clostridia bacterium]
MVKLDLKFFPQKLTQQNTVLILNAPEEYKEVVNDIKSEIHTTISGKYEFIQIFAKDVAVKKGKKE